LNLTATLLIAAAALAASVMELGAEFQVLRRQQGHFSGGAWNDDVDKWGGRKLHQRRAERVRRRLVDGA
jgi:hypothetical protein